MNKSAAVFLALCFALPAHAALSARGDGVVIAVISSGIAYRYPGLGAGFGLGSRVKGGYDFVDEDDDPVDTEGLGTVMTILAAGSADSLVPGIAPRASLLAYRVRSDFYGRVPEERVVRAIERAVTDGADIILISALGRRGTPAGPIARAVDAAVARGVIVCAAAGLSGYPDHFPAISAAGAAAGAITVSSADLEWGRRGTFSARGPTTEAVTFKPDIVHSGEIPPALAKPGAPGPDAAAARVAGMCALLRQLHPDWTPHDVKSALVTTASPLGVEVPLVRGGGVADVERAAAAEIFVSETNLMFGLQAATRGTSRLTRTLTLENRSARRQSIIVRSVSPWELKHEVVPSTLSIDAGKSATVHLTLTLDYEALPFPPDFAMGGDLIIEGDRELRVPWAFMRGARATVLYDFGDAVVSVFDLGPGPDSVYSWAPGRAEVWMKPGFYDFVKTFEIFQPPSLRVVIEEKRRISENEVVVLRERDATIPLAVHGVDERGESLRPLSGDQLYQANLYLQIEDYGAVWQDDFDLDPMQDARISPTSDRVTVAAGEMRIDEAKGRVHSVMHQPVRGLTRTPPWTNTPGSFKRATIERSAAVQAFLTLAYRYRYEGSFPFPPFRWTSATTIDFLASGESTFAYQGFYFQEPGTMESPPIYWHEGSFLIGDRKWWSPSPMTPRFGDGATIRFGLGPLRPGILGADLDAWGSSEETGYFGPLGEYHHNFAITWDLSRPGAYEWGRGGSIADFCYPRVHDAAPDDRYVERNLTLKVRGRPAPVVAEGRFGSEGGKVRLPSFSAIRVRNGRGEITDELEAGRDGSLEFSARNYMLDSENEVAMRPEATRVAWRRSGTKAWLELPVIFTGGEHFVDSRKVGHQPVGDMFRADLQPALAFPGSIDLRIDIEDITGGHVTWTQTAAFIVTLESNRRRSIR